MWGLGEGTAALISRVAPLSSTWKLSKLSGNMKLAPRIGIGLVIAVGSPVYNQNSHEPYVGRESYKALSNPTISRHPISCMWRPPLPLANDKVTTYSKTLIRNFRVSRNSWTWHGSALSLFSQGENQGLRANNLPSCLYSLQDHRSYVLLLL